MQADYYDQFLSFVLQGYVVLMPNYAGSIGYGQAALDSLPGNVGKNDVADVMILLDSCLAQGLGHKDKVVVHGGSHGGFLAAHLTGQYPGEGRVWEVLRCSCTTPTSATMRHLIIYTFLLLDRFKACVMRNPVTSINAMFFSTDIPDWCLVEAGLEPQDLHVASVEALAAMQKVSPLQYAGAVTAPTLILIGDNDLRVPPDQVRKWCCPWRGGIFTRPSSLYTPPSSCTIHIDA